MNIGELISDIGKIVVFLMVLLSIYLFTVKSEKRLSNRLFALFLIITSLDLTGFFINLWGSYPNLYLLKRASVYLQLPLFYFYVLSVCFNDFSLKRKHAWHFLLFFVFLVFFKITSFSAQSVSVFQIIAEIQYYAYMIAILVVLYRYKRTYLKNYSNVDHSVYKWLFQVTMLFLIAHIFVIAKQFFPYSGNNDFLLHINMVISVNILLITSWFVLKALYRPHIFNSVPLSGFLEEIPSARKKEKATVYGNDGRDSLEMKRLLDHMKKEKPYLDCDLTLQKLSSQTNIPEKELSALINRNLGMHFFDFVNDYRINDAKAILKDPDQKDLTTLEILYQVGFNSKSSFYTAFKKNTQQTPKQFKKEHLSKK
ncbi:helix-turn-helix domain-containing protein [Sinomicrobium weinanense]|uniref:Helix-turn-helix transcriptional regulator n=1 Tax=Sinomicrobium weinanense TaxID=2842200 RepID=A0A926JU96_9FLAO|nr:AraC family transcriptional regulator [Sinomicrobium weinanense]MBC9797642.1 helix-turn-helix transcriptional regulator [Sinomicrobium weinanense]MBU3122676.1 AraC family transcriptional regulator [Sinomicrobium weinanense]